MKVSLLKKLKFIAIKYFGMVTSEASGNCVHFTLTNAGGDRFYRNVVAILILDSVVAIFTIMTNSIFLLTIIKTTALHSPANIMVAALFACDLFVGVFGQPLYLAVLISFANSGVVSDQLEIAFETVFLLCSGYSSFVVAFVSTDRYMAVCCPYKYRRVVTNSKYIHVIACGSVAWLICTASLLALPNYFKIIQYVFFILILVVMSTVLCTYYCIYRVVRRHRRTVPIIGRISEVQNSDQVMAKREKEHSFIMAFIIGIFLILHLPYLGFTLYYIGWQVSMCKDSLFVMYLWDEFFLLLSSCMNPILYGLKRKDFRRAAIHLFKS